MNLVLNFKEMSWMRHPDISLNFSVLSIVILALSISFMLLVTVCSFGVCGLFCLSYGDTCVTFHINCKLH